MALFLQVFFGGYILLFVFFSIYQGYRYLKLQGFYGKRNAQKIFIKSLRLSPMIPNKDSNRYTNTARLLVGAGWSISVEVFYFCKYLLILCIIVFGLLIVETNLKFDINTIMQDVNFQRGSMEYSIKPTDKLVQQEKKLLDEVQQYLISSNITLDDPLAQASVQAFIESKGIYYESPSSIAKRMILKSNRIQNLRYDYENYLVMAFFILIVYLAPNFLAQIKRRLMYERKDWETLNCMTIYSIIARLPPFKIDSVAESMADVSPIYKNVINRFNDTIKRNNKYERDLILNSVDDDSMQEILETMVLGAEIGINATVDNIDDLLETKLKWMEITSTKRRQFKFMLAIFTVIILCMLMFQFLMLGLNSINQSIRF